MDDWRLKRSNPFIGKGSLKIHCAYVKTSVYSVVIYIIYVPTNNIINAKVTLSVMLIRLNHSTDFHKI